VTACWESEGEGDEELESEEGEDGDGESEEEELEGEELEDEEDENESDSDESVLSGESGGAEAEGAEAETESDTDDEAPINTIGNVPLHWYDGYDHVGYNLDGQKILRGARVDERTLAVVARAGCASGGRPVARRGLHDPAREQPSVRAVAAAGARQDEDARDDASDGGAVEHLRTGGRGGGEERMGQTMGDGGRGGSTLS